MKIALAISFFIINSLCFGQDIFEACRQGDLVAVKKMVKISHDTINSKNQGGFTPLMIAVYRDQMKIAKYLLKEKADINTLSGEGSVLMAAVYKGNSKLTQLLLKHNADVNLTNELGTTALIYAAMREDAALVKMLLTHGATKDHKEASGKSALDYANSSGNQEVIDLLK